MSLKHQLTDQVKLLQKVSIIRSNQTELEVLLLQRSPEALSRPNCWDLPGGNSEWPEENLSQANLHLQDLSREVKEETALQFAPAVLKNQLPVHFSTYFDGEKQIFTVICGWSLDFDSTNQAEIQLSAEHQAYAWVNAKSLTDYDFGGEQGAFVLDVIQQAFLNFKKLS
jgi:8-oxo-dGTP pyrophosphatase MutT (NUDIX family)